MNNILLKYQSQYHTVVDFDPAKDRLLPLDLTAGNKNVSPGLVSDTSLFANYIRDAIEASDARYAIGGYNEHRTVYSRSVVFDGRKTGDEPRRLHLGTDIWGPEGTAVYAPLGGMVHSVGFNNQFGDYGATIILLHQLDGFPFYTLYGHLAYRDIDHLAEGQYMVRGEVIGHFGKPEENGHWPPHLHFQVIYELGSYRGDYPGVCRYSEKEQWLANSPDPDLILQMKQYLP